MKNRTLKSRRDNSQTLQSASASTLRYALVLNVVWTGRLKFEDYEVANIQPLVISSLLFAPLLKRVGEKNLAKMVGVTEIVLGALIAAQPLSPRLSVIGGLGAVGMFATTLSFLFTTPGGLGGRAKRPEALHGRTVLGQGQRVPGRLTPGHGRVAARHPAA